MLTKKIKYVDFDGVERTETFYFYLSKTELTKLQLTYPGGFAEHIESVIDAKDQAKMISLFEEIIDLSYGEKSEDGKRLMKSPQLAKAFKETPAYDELFMELVTNEEAASNFVNGMMPDLGQSESERQELLAKTQARIEGLKSEDKQQG